MESRGKIMDPVIQELHAAYLEGTEPMVSPAKEYYNHYWGRGWRRGDVVKLNNKKKILVTSGHPVLTYVPLTFKAKLRYAFEEAKKLFRNVLFPPKSVPTPGFKNTIKTDGLSIYVETLQPDASVTQGKE